MITIKPFYLLRKHDVNNKSGTGIVAVGAIYPSGLAILEWLTFTASLNQYRNLDHVREVHEHGGSTEIIMGNPPTEEPKKPRRKKNAKKD